MNKLKFIMSYLLDKYPHKHEMSNARLTKTVYLADWHYLLKSGHRLTDIEWIFDNYGPFVWDIKNEAEQNPSLFDVVQTVNARGSKKTLIEAKSKINYDDKLNDEEKASLDSVIESTKKLYWDDFIRLVYSTYPVSNGKRYSVLNLEKFAQEYRR